MFIHLQVATRCLTSHITIIEEIGRLEKNHKDDIDMLLYHITYLAEDGGNFDLVVMDVEIIVS
jgi:hypothetical protein